MSDPGSDEIEPFQPPGVIPVGAELDEQAEQILMAADVSKKSKYARFIAAAALGSIPWVGGVLAAAIALQAEGQQEQLNELQRVWLREHEEKLRLLGATIEWIGERLEALGEETKERIQSEEYLSLIRKGFKAWDEADTEEKREFIRKLLSNAGGTKLTSDDVVRMFIEWIENYHEIHFKVIREIYREPGLTRARIWENIYGDEPRDDSAEADLFKLLINDLTQGYVIRQPRDTNERGQFLTKRRTGRGKLPASRVMKSAFDDEKPYVLTELGKQFVHYTMDEIVTRLG